MDVLILVLAGVLQVASTTVQIVVTADGRAVPDAQVVVQGKTLRTADDGRVKVDVMPGSIEITVIKEGFNPVTIAATATPGPVQTIDVVLDRQSVIEEHVTVSATRTDRGLEDQPMRVEVLDAEEIDEKLMMTPGDVVMMLNEMGGMRVQATSPSLGAASVRIQGMRGRYTRFLSDDIPLFGEQVSLGLMQIPPLDHEAGTCETCTESKNDGGGDRRSNHAEHIF